tara:strand:+ start:184 stop:369 length:186 start_codon:yes stop_codon:yes gene_type:complete
MDSEIARTTERATNFGLGLLLGAGYQEKLNQMLAMEEELGTDAPPDLLAWLVSFAENDEWH